MSLENLLLGLQTVFAFPQLLYLVGGVVGGLVIGALPGFTSTMGMVVLLPITFALDAVSGQLLLIGVFVGGIAGGAIPAISLNIPGTPASAATTFDGYPMYQRGQREEALGLGIIGSFIGGVTSVFMLAFLAPQIAKVALAFGPPEYFALGLLGITLIISVSGKYILRGLVAGLAGIFLATIGTDPILGLPRFTFGTVELASGFSYVPVLIGLFGFSEVLTAAIESPDGVRQVARARSWFARVPLTTLRRVLPTSLRSGAVGAFVGAIPGAGADIAAFLAYEIERRLSRTPERYGKGEPRGIVASEAGNNGDAGGAMIPMLTFGIPGDAQTAVLIAGLMLQGLKPGPLLFTEHPEVVWSIIVGLFVACIAMLVVGLITASAMVRVVAQPRWALFPVVAALCAVGAFAINGSLFDVAAMFAAGVAGYVMKRYGVPVTPVVLAMILTPMIEGELRRALIITQGRFLPLFERPIFDGLLVAAVVLAITTLIVQVRAARREFRAA